jgi:N-acetylglucosamine-6-sulfatase
VLLLDPFGDCGVRGSYCVGCPTVRAPSNRKSLATAFVLASVLMLLGGCGSSGHGAHAASTSAVTATKTAGGGVAGLGSRTNSALAAKPNIVFVLTDDLAWNLVPYMPHVLAMEHRGESFTSYFVTDSLCCPSRASIFTGRFPHDTHVTSNSPPYGGFAVFHERGEELETFATALQHVGYRTAMMGKYLNGYQPNGGAGVPASFVPAGWNEWDVAGDGYPEFGYTLNHDGHPIDYGNRPSEYLTGVLAHRGVSFIDRAAAARRPFLLEIATFAPHSPFVPAPRDANDFPGLKAPRSPAFDRPIVGAPAWLDHYKPLTPADIALINRDFRRRAQSVQAVDRLIGTIEQTLAARGLSNNTYIFFSSDNGLHMGQYRLLPGKQAAYDTDVRVPLIVVGPRVPAGRRVAQMAQNIDLCPTFEGLGGARVGRNVDGHSLVALLHGEPLHEAWRREILIEHHGPDSNPADPDFPTAGAGNPPSYEALRTPASLFAEYVTGEREYYDLRTDPFELHNLASHLSAAHLRKLRRALLAMEHCHGQRSCWRAQHLLT